jgi:hypothetical protein
METNVDLAYYQRLIELIKLTFRAPDKYDLRQYEQNDVSNTTRGAPIRYN